ENASRFSTLRIGPIPAFIGLWRGAFTLRTGATTHRWMKTATGSELGCWWKTLRGFPPYKRDAERYLLCSLTVPTLRVGTINLRSTEPRALRKYRSGTEIPRPRRGTGGIPAGSDRSPAPYARW